MAQNKHGLSRDFIIHPGETIAEFLEEKNMTQKELAIRCGVSEKHVSTVISGQKSISVDFAKKLEYALDIDAIFWINLQNNYDKEIIEFEEIYNISEEEFNIVSKFKKIFEEYTKCGFWENNLSKVDEVIEARKLFKVSNLLQISKISHIGAYRISNNNTVDEYIMYAWELLCELIDEKIESNDSNEYENFFDVELLKNSIEEIKKTMFLDTKLIIPELRKIFAKCGISFYLIKSFTGAPVQGYIRRNNRNGLSLFMTIRGSYADIFWFSLFHEIAHIINGDAKNRFIDYDKMPDELEKNANDYASKILISEKSFTNFINKKKFDLPSIIELAKENNVQPYICIGRLMKEKYINWGQFNNYRIRYKLIED